MRVLSLPVSKTFEVEDENGNWNVGFRQLTEGDNIEVGNLAGKRDVLYDNDGAFIGYRVVSNQRLLERKAIFRTLTTCDLQYNDGTLIFESKDGLVSKAMSESKFNERYDLLPQDIASEIIAKFNEMNPAGE